MAQIDWKTLGFDAYRTRTVVLSHFKDGKWSVPESTETFSFTFDPFAQVFHYAISCFEGLKAFRHKDGRIAMFRPDQNAARLQRTADYLGMPCPDEAMFIRMCEACIRGNMEFLPPYGLGASMYLRPLLVGMHPQMQLVPYPEAIFAVMCAPVGSYYGAHLKSCAAVIPGNYDRAAPKGSRKEFMVWVNSNVNRKIRGYVRMKYLGQPYNVLKKSTGYLKLKDMGVTDYKEVLSE